MYFTSSENALERLPRFGRNPTDFFSTVEYYLCKLYEPLYVLCNSFGNLYHCVFTLKDSLKGHIFKRL